MNYGRTAFALVGTALCLAAIAHGEGAYINVGHVDGIWQDVDGHIGPAGDWYIYPGIPVVFYIRYTNNTDDVVSGMINGYEISGPSTFYPATGSLEYFDHWEGEILCDFFPFTCQISHHSCDGLAADTIAGIFSAGLHRWKILPEGFSEVTLSIATGCDLEGETLCLDSVWYPMWLWAPGGRPSWDGPHCYTVAKCCEVRADVDRDGTSVDMSDLVYLVNFMFQEGPEPGCLGNTDIDGNDVGPDIADLVYLVTYMFQNGPAPVPCP